MNIQIISFLPVHLSKARHKGHLFQQTLQQNVVNNLPGPLYITPDGEPSDAEECQVFTVSKKMKGILIQKLRPCHLKVANK